MKDRSPFQNLNDVIAAIKQWADLINGTANTSSAVISSLFNEGNAFQPAIDLSQLNDSDSYHAYIGVANSQLYFFTIASTNDSKNVSFTDIQIAPIQTFDALPCQQRNVELGSAGPITNKDACLRITNWENNYVSWFTNMLADGGQIFQAFDIPVGDFQNNSSYTNYMALIAIDGGFKPDMIVWDTPNNVLVTFGAFYNTVRPVPPFGGGGSGVQKADFHLLELAEKYELHGLS